MSETLDREQIKRDAERWTQATDDQQRRNPERCHLARHCLALLAALEQAERAPQTDIQRWKTFQSADVDTVWEALAWIPRSRVGQMHAQAAEEALARLAVAEARLAKVPALVEALRWYAEESDWNRGTAGDRARQALADYEGEQ